MLLQLLFLLLLRILLSPSRRVYPFCTQSLQYFLDFCFTRRSGRRLWWSRLTQRSQCRVWYCVDVTRLMRWGETAYRRRRSGVHWLSFSRLWWWRCGTICVMTCQTFSRLVCISCWCLLACKSLWRDGARWWWWVSCLIVVRCVVIVIVINIVILAINMTSQCCWYCLGSRWGALSWQWPSHRWYWWRSGERWNGDCVARV